MLSNMLSSTYVYTKFDVIKLNKNAKLFGSNYAHI